MLTSERSAPLQLQTRVQILPGLDYDATYEPWIPATCEAMFARSTVHHNVNYKIVATMIRALFVLSLIVAVASAFVAPANHAAGESIAESMFFPTS